MARYCKKCGQMIEDSAKFCTTCGTPITTAMAEPQKNTMAEANMEKKAPETEKAPVSTRTADGKQAEKPAESQHNGKKKGFFAELWAEMLDLLKHPKKLIPTLVLSVIWLVMPLITGFITGANIPIVRFFCTLTYANGGVLGGFFGTLGGIFGKAIFAAVVSGFVLSLCAKKNPFKGVKKGFGGVFAGGLKAISPLLMGGGTGLVFYWFFNITSAPQNCAIAVVAAIAAVQAVGKQNGLLFGGVFYLLKKLSKGKAPSRIMISRILTGLSAGFAIGFALTFIRYAWVIVLLGVLLLAAGIGILFIGKSGAKKAVATAALVMMLGGLIFSFFAMPVSAAGTEDYHYIDDIAKDYDTESDEDYFPRYRGHLTYTNGRKNKRGQPFPDLMDFNNDGYVDFDDVALQKELSHNPDYLDTPEGAGLVITVITTTVIGTLGGAAASTAASGGSSVLSSLTSNLDFPEGDGDESNSPSEMTPEEREYEDMVKQTDKYISTDSEGDLTVLDPVTGAEKHYIKQEDGSYRQLESGQSYTKDEIRNDLAHVERNSGYYSDIESKRVEAAEYQSKHASDLSEDGKKMAEMMHQEKIEQERQDRLNEIGAKHGIYSGDEAEIREKMAKDQAFEEHMNEKYHEVAENIDTVTKVAEYTKKGADIAADVVATADKTGVFKDVYSATTAAAGNVGEVMAGNMTAEQALAKTAVDASTEVLKNRASTTAGKFAANIAGDAAQDATAAIVEGKDLDEITDAGMKGAARGLLDATVDYGVGSGNEMAKEAGGTYLSEAGETLASDMIKTNLPEVELPKGEK